MPLAQYINEFRTVAAAYEHGVLSKKQLKKMLFILVKEFVEEKKHG